MKRYQKFLPSDGPGSFVSAGNGDLILGDGSDIVMFYRMNVEDMRKIIKAIKILIEEEEGR